MRLLGLTAFFCFSLVLCPATDPMSRAPEDLEVSGDDLEGTGSGEGGPENVILDKKSTNLGKSRDAVPTKNQNYGEQIPEPEHEYPWNRNTIIVQESKNFIESKEALAGVIGGGIGGLVLGVVLAGFLIYKWQKKDSTGYSQSMRRTEQEYKRGALPGEVMVLV